MAEGRALLEVSRLRARYGPVQVLFGLDFTIGEGEIAVILGANGAGKTTTMRAICGMVTTEGTVAIGGTTLRRRRPEQVALLGVAHVPQGRGTFAELTVHDNLLAGAYRRRDRRAVAADIDRWSSAFTVLGQRRHQPAGKLSGGEQQMLAIARALMSRPRLLLLDEPSLGLAPIVVRDLFHQLDAINKTERIAMLIVEQNANLALGVADRAYVLESGSIVREGSAAELRADDSIRNAYLGR